MSESKSESILPYHGSCLCGSIAFSVRGFSEQVANCHCTMCRKFHGAAYGTLVRATGLQWTGGKELLTDFVCVNGTVRSFCPTCGSSVGFRVKGASLDSIELAVALFDQPVPIEVNAQIYTAYKASWVRVLDDVAAHPEGRSSGGVV